MSTNNSLVPSRSSRNNRLAPRRDDLFFPLEQQFNQWFDNFFSVKPFETVKHSLSGFPKLNVYERDGEFVVVACVAGLKAEDLKVEVTPENHLQITGRMSSEYQTPEGSSELLRELRMSSFQRMFVLPEYVEGDPDAVLKDGVLTLKWKVVEKQPENATRKIAIRSE